MSPNLAFDARGTAVLVSYLVMCLAIGGAGLAQRLRSREAATMQDHFLAGRSGLPTAVLLGTLLAQTLSGWALLGYTAAAFREGLTAMRWLTGSFMMYVGWLVVTPRLHAVGRPRRYITPADFIHGRFGGCSALHVAVSLTMLVPTLFCAATAPLPPTRSRASPREVHVRVRGQS